MWVFPLAAAVVSLVFALIILREWLRRHQPHKLAWATALAMFGVASAVAALGILEGWTAFQYRIYYLFGAISNVPFLALGTILLLAPRRVGRVSAFVVIVGTIFAAGAAFTADVNPGALASAGIPAGKDVFDAGELPRRLFRIYSYTFVIVVAGALWSAWRLVRGAGGEIRRLAAGNILIAAGTTIVALASALSRFARGSIFAIGLLIGVSVMFAGFMRTRSQPDESSITSTR